MNKARVRMTKAGAALLLCFGSAALLAEQSPPEVTAEPPGPRPLADFQPMLERPLFNANRRPLEDEEIADEGESSPDEQQLRAAWRLTGIVLEPGRQMALFSQRNGDLHQRLEVGMMLENGWELARLTEDYVELQNGDRRIEILLRDPKDLPVEPPARADTPAKKPVKTAQGKATPTDKVKPAPAANGTAQPALPLKRE